MVDASNLGMKLTKVAEQAEVMVIEQTSGGGVEQAARGIFSKENLMSFVPLLLIFAIFYFLLIRPQLKKQKEQENLVKALKKGDKIITAGGILGTIIKETDKGTFVIEIAKDAHMEILKSSVMTLAAGLSAQTSVAKKKA